MKEIFIASSTTALPQARQINDLLGVIDRVKPCLWPTIFDPGLLTLEAIERMMGSVTGAVLLASPDDAQTKGVVTVHVPRNNVVFELGMLSARLGRANIALCKYDGVELLTDLKGFTYIPMGPFAPDPMNAGHASGATAGSYASQIRVVDRVDQVRCPAGGGLTFQSETFSRVIEREEGTPPPIDGVKPRLIGVTRYAWNLYEDRSGPRRLAGSYGVLGDSRDSARITAWRD